MSSTTIYRAKCQACKHEWTSRRGAGTPNYCPACRSPKISSSPNGKFIKIYTCFHGRI